MSGRIYLLDAAGNLQPMIETAYEAEALLQKLLATHPDLLAGEQMGVASPRRWLLLRREVGVPDSGASAGRWSLDHIFLDQDGVPTFVEVKRSSDTRARREVVAQMLDYAANATSYWTIDKLQQDYEQRCADEGRDPDLLLSELLDDETPPEKFWQSVKTNLIAGRIRLVFVADEIPRELLRIVEFLNEQMNPAEVLALEVRQFVGEGKTTLVPRVLGQTTKAEALKGVPASRSWDLESMLEDLSMRKGERATEVARALHEWASRRGAEFAWGRGFKYGSFTLRIGVGGEMYPLFVVSSEGHVEVGLPKLAKHGPFSEPDRLLEFIRRLNDVPSISIETDPSRWPRIPLAGFTSDAAVHAFLSVWDWYLDTLKSRAIG